MPKTRRKKKMPDWVVCVIKDTNYLGISQSQIDLFGVQLFTPSNKWRRGIKVHYTESPSIEKGISLIYHTNFVAKNFHGWIQSNIPDHLRWTAEISTQKKEITFLDTAWFVTVDMAASVPNIQPIVFVNSYGQPDCILDAMYDSVLLF